MKTNVDSRLDALRARYVRSATESGWVGADWSLEIKSAMRSDLELLHDVPPDTAASDSRLAHLLARTQVLDARAYGDAAALPCARSTLALLVAAAGSASLFAIGGLSAEALGLTLHAHGWVLLLMIWIAVECHVFARIGAAARRQFACLRAFGLTCAIRRAEQMRDEIAARNQQHARVIDAQLAWLAAQFSLAHQRAAKARLVAARHAQ